MWGGPTSRIMRVLVAAVLALTACVTTPLDRHSAGRRSLEKSTIATAVKTYLWALARNDYQGRVESSLGELARWNRWIQTAGYRPGVEQAKLEIDRLQVRRVGEWLAKVDLEATLSFTTGKRVRISGPVLVRRSFGHWGVVDYRRNGRSQRNAIVSGVAGRESGEGVTLAAVGWVLQRDYVDVFLRVRGVGYDSIEPEGARLVSSGGKALRNGTNGPTADGFISVHIEGTGRPHRARGRFGNPNGIPVGQPGTMTDYYWAGRSLSLSVTKLRLVLGFRTQGPAGRLRMALVMRREPVQ